MIKITILIDNDKVSPVSNQGVILDSESELTNRDPDREKIDELTAELDRLKQEHYGK